MLAGNRQYPKDRPALPSEYAAIYASHYRENRDGATAASGIAQRLEAWMHRAIAADAQRGNPGATLEIGAGTLNQLPYEPDTAPYDIVEPFTALYADSPLRHRVRECHRNIADVPDTARYARITSIAAFEHLLDLPAMIDHCARRLERDGTLRVAVPSEGTPLWWIAWRLGTGVEFRLRYGLDYGPMMRHEHVNTAAEIHGLLRAKFARVQRRVFGLTPMLSLYQCFVCAGPLGA